MSNRQISASRVLGCLAILLVLGAIPESMVFAQSEDAKQTQSDAAKASRATGVAAKVWIPSPTFPESLFGGSGALDFTCTGLFCTCKGDRDCNDMIEKGVCRENGPIIVGQCTGSGDTAACWCIERF